MCFILNRVDKTAGSDVIPIPSSYAGDIVQLFVAFTSVDGIPCQTSFI
ncbi:DUF6266 family protein [Galbibacter orientalis]